VVPKEPVVSKKSGHVFEKKLIEKVIKVGGGGWRGGLLLLLVVVFICMV